VGIPSIAWDGMYQTDPERRGVLHETSLRSGLVALLFAGVAQADVIFDNFGPGNSYQAGSGWTVSGAASPTGAAYVEGMSFYPDGLLYPQRP